jgi:hypothetical protein
VAKAIYIVFTLFSQLKLTAIELSIAVDFSQLKSIEIENNGFSHIQEFLTSNLSLIA